MGKKRKAVEDLDAERTLHQSFVSAANSISQLFTQAVAQHKKSHAAGARHALERQLNWVLREYGNSPTVPTQTLLQVLQSELLNVDELDAQYAAAWPSQPPGAPPLSEDPNSDDNMSDQQQQQQQASGPRLSRYQSPGKPLSAPFHTSWR